MRFTLHGQIVIPSLAIAVLCIGAVLAEPPDYSKQLPRIAPTEPKDAAKSFTVAPGFQIQLVAHEPNVCSPVAAAFDEEGRMYVVEMRDYPELNDPPLGRVRLLEDRDDDGFYETSSIYAEGFSWPTAITCWNGGVFLAAAPEIFYLKDADGDRQADERRVVFTGFGKGNVQGLINSFAWTLDNKISLSTSSGGATVRRPDRPNDPAVNLRGQDMAFDPRTLEIIPLSGGGQHGRSADDWGRVFVCSNSDHLQQVLWEDRYLARNPWFAVPSPRASIAVDGPQADVFRASSVEPWRVLRTRLRVTGVVPGLIEGGGRDSGYFTSATGVTIYRGDPVAWKVPNGKLLAIIGDVGGNLIHRKLIEGDGWQLTGKRIDDKSELVMSKDNWFRPVQFVHAPDGSLLVLDMYREVIEHPASLPPDIKKHLNLTSGRERGRIWRLAPDGFQHRRTPALVKLKPQALVGRLSHPNEWERGTASRLICERRDPIVVEALRELAADNDAPSIGRLRACYALRSLPSPDANDALDAETLAAVLASKDTNLLRAALVLMESPKELEAKVVSQLQRLVAECKDRSVMVQLVLSLGNRRATWRDHLLVDLIRRQVETNDAALKTALQTTLSNGAGAILGNLLMDDKLAGSAAGAAWITLLARQIGRQQNPDDLAAVAVAWKLLEANPSLRRTILIGLEPRPGSSINLWIEKNLGGTPEELLAPIFAASRKLAANRSADLAARVAAIGDLKLATDLSSREVIFELLSPTEPVEVQLAAVETLSSFPKLDFPESLRKRLPSFGPRVRPAIIELLVSRRPLFGDFFLALEEKGIAAHEVPAARRTFFLQHPDSELRAKAKQYLDLAGSTPRAEVAAAHLDVLKFTGDSARGKEAFKKVCAACHQLQGVGTQIGPNLAAMRARGAEAMLVNLLDPNREVNPQFVTYVVSLKDGRSATGMIAAETATSLTLVGPEGKQQTILRGDIEEIRSTGQSLMPEGIEKQYDKQALADLLSFLMTP